MRLIDADKLMEHLEKVIKDNPSFVDVTHIMGMQEVVKEQPTAYDADKVVKELNEWTFNANIDVGDGTVMNRNLIVRDTAIEIVKAGGIDDQK